MDKISSGIKALDRLTESLHVGDNVIWEVEAGTSFEVFMSNFIRQSVSENKDVIYVSFNKSPQSILQQIGEMPHKGFILLDCFTSGKGKNDKAFSKFYEDHQSKNVTRVDRPGSIENFSNILNSIEDSLPAGACYIFDSLTGMQDLWGDEQSTYKFFTYMCPRLYDLSTVAYWIIEKEAHSTAFKANLRHITQVVLELYKRKDSLYIKALKLDGRHSREAFKPHPYSVEGSDISIAALKRDMLFDIGTKLKEIRTRLNMSQKDLADRINLTASFISQLENNQISPSLNSFIEICNALRISPDELWRQIKPNDAAWLIKKEKIRSNISLRENGLNGFSIFKNGSMSGSVFTIEPDITIKKHFIDHKGKQLIYVLNGSVSVSVEGKEEKLIAGDSLYLKEELPSLWKNGGDKTELLVICL